MSIGTDLGGSVEGLGVSRAGPVGPGPDGALPVLAARRKTRSVQLPRSPKIITGLALLAAFFVLAVVGPWVAPYNPSASLSTTNGVPQPPSAAHWLGTTQVQQDVFSQLLTGARSTFLVAFLAGVVATVLSVLIGVCSGYWHGRWADNTLSMLANFFLVLPALPLLIVIFGFLPPSSGGNDLLIGLIIAITGWAWGARVLRAQTLSLRSRDYVELSPDHRRARLAGHRVRDPAQPAAGRGRLVPVHRAVRGGHLHRAGLPRAGQPGALELGLDAVRGAELRRRAQRLLVVVHPAGADGGVPRHLAGPAQLRHRRVHQPPAAGGRADPAAGQEGGRPGLPRRFVLGLTPVVRATNGADPASASPEPAQEQAS